MANGYDAFVTRRLFLETAALGCLGALAGCASTGAGSASAEAAGSEEGQIAQTEGVATDNSATYEPTTLVSDVVAGPAFWNWGRLLFPVHGSQRPDASTTLATLGGKLTWYNYYDVNATIDVLEFLRTQSLAGRQVFFDIYSEEEKTADPAKRDTGLVFFPAQGASGPAPFAIWSAGGGMVYVGAMHDSFPHALHIARSGRNAFALLYRPGAQTACEDLARAIAFAHDHADELGVDVRGYALGGGSAGARMAAWLGEMGTVGFGAEACPRPAAVIMQYTGLSQYSPSFEPATYACCGTDDWIADWRTMQGRLNAIAAMGVPTEFRAYEGLPHGFGLGAGTVAQGWIDGAIAFWEENR